MRISDWSSDVCSSDLAMVKRMFADESMTARFNIGAVNSINWARLMAQVVYYFAAGLQLGAPHRQVAFSVPTGNFGDVFAGYVAHQMGLPIAQLIVATNVNDILHRALSDGDRSEEHTSELQSLMRSSYAVFCLKKKKHQKNNRHHNYIQH